MHRDVIKSAGLKVTPARLRIVSILATAKKPLAAAEIHARLHIAGISLVTVYRTIATMRTKKIIRKVFNEDREALYELAASEK